MSEIGKPVVRHTDVLVVGAGAAGMYAAAEASRHGRRVTLLDKSKVGRGGATIMAQMTVAAALGHAEEDSWELHLGDTLASGRGLADERLAALLCREAPDRILESRDWGVRWATDGDRLAQVHAPGHSRRRCCYVGSLQTGPGVVSGLRRRLARQGVESFDTTLVTDLVLDADGAVVGAAALDVTRGQVVSFWADAVILAGGGLTEMYARNSASVNMTGDAYALGLAAGARLVDIEMVQFFPIANLAPRVIGLDPIMWDPFRYKLGGRLLNGRGEEFLERYTGQPDDGVYTATRDVVTYGILREVEEGRGSPAGGAWLDFTDVPVERVREAFPAAHQRLLDQGIDISRQAVEVAPTAHYTIGGLEVDEGMSTGVPGLLAAGEAVGGQHGANRLSGNALTEAFVFGAKAGASAARAERRRPDPTAREHMRQAVAIAEGVRGCRVTSPVFLPALRRRLQQVMWEHVGPRRDADGLVRAATEIAELRMAHADARVDSRRAFNLEWQEWLEFRGMLTVAEAVRLAAEARRESRGAHQRDDHPFEDAAFQRNTVVRCDADGMLHVGWRKAGRRSAGVGPRQEPFDGAEVSV